MSNNLQEVKIEVINQKLHQVVDHLNQRKLAKVSEQGDTQPKTMASQSRRRAEP